jgi:hypothetical protein
VQPSPSRVNLRAVDPRRLSAGEWIAAGGAVLLIVSLFLPWYTVAGEHVTAWQSMTVDDVLLAAVGLGTLTGAGLTMRRSRPAVPVVYASLSTIVALIVVLWRIADPAPAAHASRAVGAWLGLAGAAVVAVASWIGMGDEGPARRSDAAERAAANAALERAELVSLPPDAGQTA